MKLARLVPFIIGLVMFSLCGCTTYNPVALQQKDIGQDGHYYHLQPQVYIGDHLKYGLKDGSGGEISVAKIEPNAIIADTGKIIPFTQISFLERQDISKGKTAALVGGGAVATTAIVIVAGLTIVAAGIAASVA
ncbi:hypothetical protein [Serratia grimesii]|uniref:hypothetical protein n=1 Tax=Serratia grimesii TaxID=82995 RepID=UPI00217B2623|nr:hypothetical protein [Serratia grimesii]CAI0757468.1 Uncharacterised protein [Serratia grimesii]